MNHEDEIAVLEYWIDEEYLCYCAIPFVIERAKECRLMIAETMGKIALIEMNL